MKLLGTYKDYYFFCPRKKEDTTRALDRISETFNDADISYVGMTTPTDQRINGFTDALEHIQEKVDWEKYNLIIVRKINDNTH